MRSLIAPGQAQGARGGGGGGGGCGCGCPGGELRMVMASRAAERRRPGDMGDATTRVGSIASRGGLSGAPVGGGTGFKLPTSRPQAEFRPDLGGHSHASASNALQDFRYQHQVDCSWAPEPHPSVGISYKR